VEFALKFYSFIFDPKEASKDYLFNAYTDDLLAQVILFYKTFVSIKVNE
jgi:hypothetical protein